MTRIISGEEQPHETLAPDKALRPQTLAEFVGQQAAKGNLKVFIDAARGRREPLNSYEHYKEAAANIGHAKTYEHPEGGVYAFETHPADFAQAVANYIGDLGSGA